MNKCYTNYTNIGKFISNVNGNWRNSIYVTCSVCKAKKEACCDDLMVSFDANGVPTIILVTDANYIFGTIIDKSECLCEMSNARFKYLFENHFEKNIDSESGVCPYLQMAKLVTAGNKLETVSK